MRAHAYTPDVVKNPTRAVKSIAGNTSVRGPAGVLVPKRSRSPRAFGGFSFRTAAAVATVSADTSRLGAVDTRTRRGRAYLYR